MSRLKRAVGVIRWHLGEMRVGPIFHHDQIHRVEQNLPIAFVQLQQRSSHEAVIAVTGTAPVTKINRLGWTALRAHDL